MSNIGEEEREIRVIPAPIEEPITPLPEPTPVTVPDRELEPAQ